MTPSSGLTEITESPSLSPTSSPSERPSTSPTKRPTTSAPTASPFVLTISPTVIPSQTPSGVPSIETATGIPTPIPSSPSSSPCNANGDAVPLPCLNSGDTSYDNDNDNAVSLTFPSLPVSSRCFTVDSQELIAYSPQTYMNSFQFYFSINTDSDGVTWNEQSQNTISFTAWKEDNCEACVFWVHLSWNYWQDYTWGGDGDDYSNGLHVDPEDSHPPMKYICKDDEDGEAYTGSYKLCFELEQECPEEECSEWTMDFYNVLFSECASSSSPSPTSSPSERPSTSPTNRPTTSAPTEVPTISPTKSPTTLAPTTSPSVPTISPTPSPTGIFESVIY